MKICPLESSSSKSTNQRLRNDNCVTKLPDIEITCKQISINTVIAANAIELTRTHKIHHNDVSRLVSHSNEKTTSS